MSRIYTGLDVGSHNVRAVVAQLQADDKPQVLGTGLSPAQGMRRGVVVDLNDVALAIQEAIKAAQAVSGLSIRAVSAGVNGVHIQVQESRGVVAVSRADKEIGQSDMDRAIKAAETITIPQNKEIIEVIARTFNIDNEGGIKDPIGMNGIRLEVNALLITASSPFIKNLTKAIEKAKLDVRELVAGPMASAEAVLSKRQKELGVVVIDIGAETSSMAVYEEGEVAHVRIFPVGSAHITNDIAIGLRTDLDTAEKVKVRFGSCLPEAIRKTEIIDLSEVGVGEQIHVRRQEVAEIIVCRMREVIDLVNRELEKINRKGFLPAGAILVGGGAKIPGLVELAKNELMLPVKIGYPGDLQGLVDQVADPAFAKAVGLIRLIESGKEGYEARGSASSGVKKKVISFFRNLLP